MIVSIEDMRDCVQEWFAEAHSFEDLRDIHYAIKSEADKQFVYMAEQIANDLKV